MQDIMSVILNNSFFAKLNFSTGSQFDQLRVEQISEIFPAQHRSSMWRDCCLIKTEPDHNIITSLSFVWILHKVWHLKFATPREPIITSSVMRWSISADDAIHHFISPPGYDDSIEFCKNAFEILWLSFSWVSILKESAHFKIRYLNVLYSGISIPDDCRTGWAQDKPN